MMGHDRRAVVVGGSIAGLSCAHALLQTGFFSVVVLEKAGAAVSAAGAGLGLDRDACAALTDWGLGDALLSHSLPLNAEEVKLCPLTSGTTRVHFCSPFIPFQISALLKKKLVIWKY